MSSAPLCLPHVHLVGAMTCLVVNYVGGQVPPRPADPVAGGRAAAVDPAVEGQRRLARARDLLERDAKDEALAELAWCFDRCRGERAFCATRLGEVLDAWGSLAKVHPPARAALEARRDARDRAVRAGALGNDDVAELLALNEVLGDASASLRAFDEVSRRRAPADTAFFYEGVRVEMWRQRRYRSLIEGRPHPEERLQTAAVALREASKRLVGHDLRPDPRFAQRVLADVCLDVEARVALDDLAGARALVTAARQFAPEPQTAARLIAHAERAGDDSFVGGLRREAERGLDAEARAELARSIEAAKAELRQLSKPTGG
ncbi:MAG: hypothetical protein R3F56_07395 [Planctomycetota bacterium]